MLYLNPPFHVINGVSLFPDHADPLQYYYLPVAPKLTMIRNEATGKLIPQFQLLKYRDDAGNGGFLNFDVNIGVEDDALQEIATRLRSLERLDGQVRLAPVPLVSGTVKMLLFGTESGDTPAGGVATSRFVPRPPRLAKPSLYGDNQATFSVELSQEGVSALDAALRGEMSPIGIVYSLDYLALRPAYSVRLHIDWDRVQKRLDDEFGASLFIFSTEIEKVVDELIDKRVIELDVDTFVPEGEDEKAMIARRDQAQAEVMDMITNAFFEPSLHPDKPAADGWDKAEQLAKTATKIAVTGGWSEIGAFSYRNTNYTRIDRKVLNVTINERTTVQRTIAPQGHLTGVLRVLKEQGLDPNDFILSVDLNDPWFKRRKVKVISRAAFEEDGITSINVRLDYAGQSQGALLSPSTTEAALEWPSDVVDGAMRMDVAARYRVNFKDADSAERPREVESPPETVIVEAFEVDPRDLYAIIQVPIVTLSFPWDRYPQVEVLTSYHDAAHGIRMNDTFMLDASHPEAVWRLFMLDPTQRRFAYKLIYRAADHRDREMTWVEQENERIVIRDPFPNKRTLTVVPQFNWDEVAQAFVDVRYEDPANHILTKESFEFTKDDQATKTFTSDLADPDHRLVTFAVDVVFRDGHLVRIPASMTFDRRIFVQSDLKGHMIVPVRPADVDFAIKHVREMRVEIHLADAPAGLDFQDIFTFKSPGDRAIFEFDYVDVARAHYAYRTTYLLTNGLSRTTDWQASDAGELVIPVG